MKSHARVVVVGGGVMGVGLLYHLALEGWSDIVLIEKGELTSGSTWHAAGQCPHFNGSLNMTKVHLYGTELYPQLEKLTGQAVSWHGCGGLRLATTDEEVSWLKYVYGISRLAGYECEIIGPSEIKQYHPYLETFGIKAAVRIAINRMKAEKPQDAQVILADAGVGIPDKAQTPRQQIGQATQRIDDLTAGIGVKRVHGKVAAGRVFGHVRGKSHHRMTTVCFNIAPEGGHLMRLTVGKNGDGAMLQPRWNDTKTGSVGYISDCFGQGVGGDIDVRNRHAQQGVAHTAPHEQGAIALRSQCRAKCLRACMVNPIARNPHAETLSAKPRRMRAVAPQM